MPALQGSGRLSRQAEWPGSLDDVQLHSRTESEAAAGCK
ncbi:hypothetical protein EH2_02860 [Bacillus subtilis]|nr:hypothetical protein ABU16_2285 [Bacillus subtilis]RPK17550.1 hypothetical protein EH2_02860 [Bacillus subtilis]